MCGRFTLRTSAGAVAEQFSLLEIPSLQPRFNIAPSQPVAVVRAAEKGTGPICAQHPEGRSGKLDLSPFPRQLAFLRWGLVPAWAGDTAIGNRLINARAETAAQKPAFRAAFRQRRCLIVADGFYEWQREGRRRQPYFFRLRDDGPLGFAGLWESWQGPDQTIESCTILTTTANELVRPIHDRMPVIVARADYAAWLDPAEQRAERLLELLRPYASEAMAACAVSPWVNSPAHDDPQCIEPAGEP